MGILINACSIFFGGALGSFFKNRIKIAQSTILGITMMLISLSGIIENLFSISDSKLKSDNLIPVVFSLIIGTTLGELLNLNRFSRLESDNAFITGCFFFGIGGLQISGPILLALKCDNSQLIMKSFVDFPFAVALGASLGFGISFSCIPVAILQILIAFIAYFAGSYINADLPNLLSALGYIILFFTGFNFLVKEKYKVATINMLPSFFILIILNSIIGIVR